MKRLIVCSLLSGTFVFGADLQTVFRYHEAYLLERRIGGGGEKYERSRAASYWGLDTPSPTREFVFDPNKLSSYRDENIMKSLLAQINYFSYGGRWQQANHQYNQFLNMLRRAQGPNSIDEAFVLDIIGMFYLRSRDFDLAYKRFGEAAKITRQNLLTSVGGVTAVLRLHLADILTSMGEIDSARGQAPVDFGEPDEGKKVLDLAERELKEAVETDNQPSLCIFVNRLDGPYFESLLLERQKRWTEAEDLWRQTVTRREKVGDQSYSDAIKEMAAFYARKGDFLTAARLAAQVLALPKQNKTLLPAPYWIDPRSVGNTRGIYESEADSAIREILAVQKWLDQGAEAATPMLQATINTFFLDKGDDSDRLRYLSWLNDKASLHLSILLDAQPPPDRVAEAYSLVGTIQGRYLAATATAGQRLSTAVGNRNVQDPRTLEPSQLADIRERRSHLFVTHNVDGKPIDPAQYAAAATDEIALTEAILSADPSRGGILSLSQSNLLEEKLPAGVALVNFVAWNRINKSQKVNAQREFGAFVVRKGSQTRYIKIGSPDSIDGQVRSLSDAANEFFNPSGKQGTVSVSITLRTLYQQILEPLAADLKGVQRILIVPDSTLALVPFEALIDEHGDYFLKEHVVSYLTSWRDIHLHATDARPKSPSLILANPDFDLTLAASSNPARDRSHFSPRAGTQKEAQSVQNALGLSPDRILVGKDAREGILGAMPAPEILHFATHSVATLPAIRFGSQYDLFEYPSSSSAQDPLLLSVIALAGANRPQEGLEDGLLTGLEVASLDLLGTRLVVLSSCQSGAGITLEGQGVIGLRSAFLMAGAQSLVMNIWDVSDEAGPVFMGHFYEHLRTNSVPDAVRLAQLDLSASPQFKNPLYWAGFAQTGAYEATETAFTWSAPTPVQDHNVMVPPRCYEISGRSEAFTVNQFKLRIKIGGVVGRKLASAETVIYDLDKPGNQVELDSDYEAPWRSSEHPPAILKVERTNEHSAIYINAGSTTTLAIVMEGSVALFKSFDLPALLPPKANFRRLSIKSSRIGAEAIDYVGVCTAEVP